MAAIATTSAQAQQKFSNLRKRLDQLGYRQTLGVESLPLIERLFADLIHTTESLKNAKLDLGTKETHSCDVDSAIEPYKSDNAKLVKESNELHQQLIKLKDSSDSSIRELKASLRKLEHDSADLKFLNNQYVHKVRASEKESKEKTDRILHLQEKNFHAVVQTPGGRKKSIPFRRQRMDIDCTVPECDRSSRPIVPSPDDPYIADLLQVADSRIAELEREIKDIRDAKEINERKLTNFRKQVDARDEEIERMSRMLDGGRPSDVVALEARNRANERMISHLNIQVDFLQQKTREMERKLKDSTFCREEADTHLGHYKSRNKELTSHNQDLEKELNKIDHMAKLLQSDKDLVMKTADREIIESKTELEKSRHDVDSLDLTVSQYKAENKRLGKECNETKAVLTKKQGDLLRLNELLDRVQEDKKRLSHRVNKLLANEKELVLEIERLKRKNGPASGKKGKIPSKLDAFIRTVEEERNYYRDQNEALQKICRGDIQSHSPVHTRPSSRSASPVRENTAARADKKNLAQYETIIRVLEEERDYYKKEYEALKAVRKSVISRTSPTKTLTADPEIARLTRERDEMRALLDKFERHMAEIQANVKVLTSERDKLNTMYDETKEELQRARREIIRSPKSPKTSLAAQAVLRRVENERDDALSDLRRITTDRDSLRERLKIATELSLSERAKLEQRIEDLESQLDTVEAENNELVQRMMNLKDDNRLMEDQVKDQALRLADYQDEASQQKSTATQMKLLVNETERSLEGIQRRLSQREIELNAQEDRAAQLGEQIAELNQVNKLAKDEASQLRITISALDREKDSLQLAVDEKTEKLAGLNNDLLQKEKLISDLKIRISEIDAQLSHSNDTLNLKERELKSLRRQIDSVSEDLNETSRGKDVALRENRRLQDDLAVMTRENQKLNQELQDALEEKESLKTQVQDYMMEVRRTEDLLAAKEDERSDLLEQYRALSAEAEHFQTSSHQLESEGSNMRLELITKDSELRRNKDKVDNLEREIQEHLNAQQAYEIQISTVTRSVANFEENLRQTEDDKQILLEDLTAVRELCAQFESSKDNLHRQLTSLSLEKEQLNGLIDDMKQETELLHSQFNTERSSVKNLEEILQTNREKEFQSQLATQEKSAESQMLKDRLSLNESKIQGQGREVASLRTRNVELEGDVERLRRQLTNEKFERERAVQELRRNGITPPVLTVDYSSRLSTPTRSPGRSASPSRYRSLDSSYVNSPDRARPRSPERSSYHDDLLNTTPRSLPPDLI